MTCYRHPKRETGVSCSECGRGICPDCMVFAPVGISCPDHAGRRAGHRKGDEGRSPRRLRGHGRARHEGDDRDQRPRLPRQPRPGLEPESERRLTLRQGSPLHPGRARPGRVVPADHRGVPPRKPVPPRDEHVRALDRGRAGRAGDRPRALPGALHRLRARRLGRGAPPEPGCDHRRRLRRDLRNPRRRARARVTEKLRPRRTGLRADRVQPRSSRSRSRATSRSAATWAASPPARSACSRSRGSAGRTRSTAARG